MTPLAALARMLGIKPELAEDALHSERAARAVLTRRNLFAASGALAAGSVFSFGAAAESAIVVSGYTSSYVVTICSVDHAARLFGRGSSIHLYVESWFKRIARPLQFQVNLCPP